MNNEDHLSDQDLLDILGITPQEENAEDIQQKLQDIAEAEPTIDVEDGGNFSVSLPHDCSVTGYILGDEIYIQFMTVPKAFQKNGIGKRLLKAVYDHAIDQNVDYIAGHITSLGALKLAKQKYGEELQFFDENKNPIDSTYEEILDEYQNMGSEFEGSIRFRTPISNNQ